MIIKIKVASLGRKEIRKRKKPIIRDGFYHFSGFFYGEDLTEELWKNFMHFWNIQIFMYFFENEPKVLYLLENFPIINEKTKVLVEEVGRRKVVGFGEERRRDKPVIRVFFPGLYYFFFMEYLIERNMEKFYILFWNIQIFMYFFENEWKVWYFF